MQIIKPLHSVFLHKTLFWRRRHISTFSGGYFFRLDTGDICFEPTAWAEAVKAGYGKDNFDEAVFKTRGEFIVVGNAIAPNGTPTQRMLVKAKVGAVEKQIVVSGQRCWNGTRGTPQQPLPFTAMPLSYAMAFGGPRHPQNPVGMGVAPQEQADGPPHHPLPSLEYADAQMLSSTDVVPPAAFGCLAVDWAQRKQWAGTYDSHYLSHDIPGLANDVDWRFFQQTSPDQWANGFWKPDESYLLTGMNASKPSLAGTLPNVTARCFVRGDSFTAESVREIPLALDTVWFFPNENLGLALFRGAIDVKDLFASDIKGVLCALERASDVKRSYEHYLREFQVRSDLEKGSTLFLHQAPLMPEGFQMNLGDLVGEAQDVQAHTLTAAMNAYADAMRASQQAPPAPPPGDAKPEDSYRSIATGQAAAFAELVQQAFPPLRDATGKITGVDLAKTDLSRLAPLFSACKDMRQNQVEDAVKRLREDLRALDAVPHSDHKASQVIALTTLIATFSEKPVLSRPPGVSPSQDAKKMLDEARAKLEIARQEGKVTAFVYGMKRKELEAGEILVNRAASAGSQGYRLSAHFQPPSTSPHAGREKELAEKFFKNVRNQESCSGSELAFCAIDGADLTGVDVSGGFLEYTRLTGCRFSSGRLAGAIVVHANIRQCNFDHANLDEANLGKSEFFDCSFRHCSTLKTILTQAAFFGCVFEHCDFSDSPESFLGATFSSCTFIDCKLGEKIISNTHFEDNRFLRTDMSGAIFSSCSIKKTVFDDCTMEKANFIGVTIEETRFDRSNLENIRFYSNSRISDSSFTGTRIRNANFRAISLSSTTFAGADGTQADFSNARMDACVFDKFSGVKSQWVASHLMNCRFYRAHLLDSSFLTSTLERCDFYQANLYGTSFLQSTLKANSFREANLRKTLLEDWRP